MQDFDPYIIVHIVQCHLNRLCKTGNLRCRAYAYTAPELVLYQVGILSACPQRVGDSSGRPINLKVHDDLIESVEKGDIHHRFLHNTRMEHVWFLFGSNSKILKFPTLYISKRTDWIKRFRHNFVLILHLEILQIYYFSIEKSETLLFNRKIGNKLL